MSLMVRSLKAHGKCILAGEHSVVRGSEALVLPLKSRSLELSWETSTDGNFHLPDGPFASAFRDSLSRALELSGFALPHPGYMMRIRSDIPVQAGLGSSAALAVAIVQFLLAEGATIRDPFTLALEIENIFHGKSSGIDVACVLASNPIRYARNAPPEELRLSWQPLLYLFDTGLRSSTKECVARVESAARLDLDQRMNEAVQLAKSALVSNRSRGLGELAHAIDLAASCFHEWGLGASEHQVMELKRKGAIAVKPTGSGGGGFLLTLWEREPPKNIGLIPVWENPSKDL